MNSRARGILRTVLRTPALTYRDLKLLGAAGVFDSIGFMGENLVLGWLMLQLTDSAFMVGAVLSVKMVPSLFLGLLAGTIADMVDRLILMRVLNILLAGLASGVGVLIFTDSLQIWHLFALTPIGGAMGTLYMTLRQSYVYDIVGADHLMNGLAFVSIGMRAGGLIGSLSMGFILGAFGSDIAYLAIAISYIFSTGILLLIRSHSRSAASAGQHVWGNLKRFGIEMRRNSTLTTLVVLTAMVEFVGFSSQVLMPSLAKDVLEVGPEGLGVMSAFRSVGGIVALVIVGIVGDQRRKGLAYLIVLAVFGAALFLLGLASNFVVVIFVITIVSGMMAMSDIYSQSIMQVVVPNELRGRAMGAWVLATGTASLGNLQVGALASAFTIGIALGVNGVALIALATLSLVFLPKLRRL